MFAVIVIYAVIIGYLGLTMYLANYAEQTGERESNVRTLLYLGALLIFLLGPYIALSALSSATLAEQGEDVPQISTVTVVAALILSGLASGTAFTVINSSGARQRLERLIGGHGGYDAGSIVHTTAVVLVLLLLTGNTVSFLLQGGVSGMAEEIETQGVPVGQPVFEATLQILAAFLGVGYAIRRGLPAALERLGLRWPTRDDLIRGLQAGIGAYVAVLVIVGVLVGTGILSEEALEQQSQAAEELVSQFSTLPLAFLLSVSAAVGEETFFRGALQPIFGNVPTSIVFALLHRQFLFSPQLIVLFIVSLILGWLRSRYSTTAAIFGHFIYNFIQLALGILLPFGE